MLFNHPVKSLLQCLMVGLFLDQHDGRLSAALRIADRFKSADPGGMPMNCLSLGFQVMT
jgi:hypothetical protein